MVSINIHDARQSGRMKALAEDGGGFTVLEIGASNTTVTFYLPPECLDAAKRAAEAINEIASRAVDQRKLAAE